MIVYYYRRFSTSEQESSDSLRRQDAALDAWLKAHPEAVLDTSLDLTDKGVSGFLGQHSKSENAGKYALAGFVHAVEIGRVKAGSFLIVENLDRLTRQAGVASVSLCLSLIQRGITIVALTPYVATYDAGMDLGRMVTLMSELQRGHGESDRKRQMMGAVWNQKKKNAADTVVSRKVPGWVKVTGVKVKDARRNDYAEAKLDEDPEKADVVRRMFAMAVEGKGVPTICVTLNKEGIPNWGSRSKSKRWTPSTVYEILTSRRVIGEYQPHKGNKVSREAVGDAVKGYYPVVVSEELFDRVQGCISRRRITGAGRKSVHVNLFSGLMVDARDGGAIHACRANRRPSKYETYNAKTGKPGSVYSCFPLEGFDRMILESLAEVQLEDEQGNELADLSAQVTGFEERLKKLSDLVQDDPTPELVASIKNLSRKRQETLDKMESARQRLANKPAEALGKVQGLIASGGDRERLANAIRGVVRELRCLFIGGRGEDRVALVYVSFHGTDAVRTYWITYVPKRGNRHSGKAASAESFTCQSVRHEDMPPEFSISTPEGLKVAESVARLITGKKH
jgi:DNA invertase Pin-like site-specific DNA recombinase